MTTYYMHTLNGQPAAFDGEMICQMRTIGNAKSNVMATSLKQIREEQKASNRFRERGGFAKRNYGYVRVYVPVPTKG